MEQSRLKELEDQCIQDCAPPCISACPAHVDIRGMLKAISSGDFAGGLGILRKSVPFPGIIAHVCDQPCQINCYRNTIGGPIEVAQLEQACVDFGQGFPTRELQLPRRNMRVTIIGGGLCGMTAALELYRKGYDIYLYEMEHRLGGQLWQKSKDELFEQVIQRETQILDRPGIAIHLNHKINSIEEVTTSTDAVFIACGIGDLDTTNLEKDTLGRLVISAETFQAGNTQFFGGGSFVHEPSPILAISDGKRAAISIDRYMQKVSITAARTDEGAYPSRLFTSIKGVPQVNAVVPRDPAYSREEAVLEANRCLQCECMECVKVCEYLKQFKSYPRKYVREIYNNLTIIKRTRSANKLINSCTQCGLCKEVCPTDLDMGRVTGEARKTMVDSNKMPASAHDFALRDMAFSNSDRFAARLVPDGKRTCDFAFFPGCQLAASNPEYIPKIVHDLQRIIPNLGLLLGCCGAPAEWSGESSQFSQALTEFITGWHEMGEPKLILACSSCNQILSRSIPPEKMIPIWEVYNQNGIINSRSDLSNKDFVVHDPCTSRHDSIWQENARTALRNLGASFHELGMSRNLTECCGYGGVAWLANPPIVRDMIARRVAEDSADYLAYCVMCRDLFTASGKRTLHIFDLIYAQDLEKAASRKSPDYSQRHENRVRVKLAMEKEFLGKEYKAMNSFEKYHLLLSDEMREKIESRLILLEDIQKVIEHAETTGEKFINQNSGHILAYFKPNIITYWVDYAPQGNQYVVFDAYSHRMEFESKGAV